MKHFRTATVVILGLAIFAGGASAQRKAVRKPVPKKATVKILPPLDVRAGREKVDNQLSNVNDFVNKLGTIAQGLEVADADAKAGNLSAKTAAKIEGKKNEIVVAIRNIKVALTNLESEFRTKPALQKYLVNIQGITDLAAQAEDSAIAGKFVAAKDPLREVAKKLTDTLGAMPL
ncbi:MAG: hypothetical protein ABIP78_06240 [Pyrinomonadaceae bacterium]